MQEFEDRNLINAIANGDEAAFATFYSLHFDRLATDVLYILKDKAPTEEVLQDVFFTIWNQREKIAAIRNMEGYLAVLARNAALNRIKADVRRRKMEQDFLVDHHTAFELIDTTAEQHAYDKLLEDAIDQLPQQQKRAFILSRFDRKKYLEIANDMGISRETVKKYLQLASLSIKNYMLRRKDSIITAFLTLFFF